MTDAKPFVAEVNLRAGYAVVAFKGCDPGRYGVEDEALGLDPRRREPPRPPSKRVIIDLSELVPIPGAGVFWTLKDLPQTYGEVGAEVRFVLTTPVLIKMFRGYRVPKSLLYGDLESAAASFGKQKPQKKLRKRMAQEEKQAAAQEAKEAALDREYRRPAPLRLPPIGASGWARAARKKIGPILKSRGAIRRLCREVLSKPRAITQSEWPQLMKAVVAASMSFTRLAKAPRSLMEDDEGGVLAHIADWHLYTWDWALEVLRTPAAIAHPKWAELVELVARAKWQAVGSDRGFAADGAAGAGHRCARSRAPAVCQGPARAEKGMAAQLLSA